MTADRAVIVPAGLQARQGPLVDIVILRRQPHILKVEIDIGDRILGVEEKADEKVSGGRKGEACRLQSVVELTRVAGLPPSLSMIVQGPVGVAP